MTIATNAAPASAATITLKGTLTAATPVPSGVAGSTSVPASNWTGAKVPNSFSSGDSFTIQIADPGDTTGGNCAPGHPYVGFAGTPTATMTPDPANSGTGETVPTFTTQIQTASGDSTSCAAQSVEDLLTITMTDKASGPTGDSWDLVISQVTYNVSANNWGLAANGANPGPIEVSVDGGSWSSGAVSNLFVSLVNVTSDSPAVSVPNGQSAQGASNIVMSELVAGAIANNTNNSGDTTVCLTLSGATSAPPSVWTTPSTSANVLSVKSGNDTVLAGPNAVGTVLSFTVSLAATPTATTFVLSSVSLNTPGATGPVTLTISNAPTPANCAAGNNTVRTGDVVVGSAPTSTSSNRFAGTDAENTAQVQFEAAYPPSTLQCPSSRTALLATDATYSDALAGAYLAGELGTGIVLTSPTSLSQSTLKALADEGITNVDALGGNLAISDSVVQQLDSTAATTCGNHTGSGNITVTRISGSTEYDTAQQIAAKGSSVGSYNLGDAYSDTLLDDTGGNSSSAPTSSGALLTAIIASGTEFSDAEAASVLSYKQNIPILLTDPSALPSQTSSELSTLKVTQAIVLGGPLAVSSSVVSTIQGLGISVIRVAGHDGTDTAQLIAQLEQAPASAAGTNPNGLGFGWKSTHVSVAQGSGYTDGIAGSAFASVDGPEPVLLTESPTTVGPYLASYLNQEGAGSLVPGITVMNVFGGLLAMPTATLDSMLMDVAQG